MAFEEDRLGFLESAERQFGGLVAFDSRAVVVNDMALARQVLKQPSSFGMPVDFLQRPVRGADVVGEAGNTRTALRPLLRPQAVAHAGAVTSQLCAESLAGLLRTATTWEGDPQPVLEGITSRVIAELYFGGTSPNFPGLSARLLDALSRIIGNPFSLPASWPTPTRRAVAKAYVQAKSEVVTRLRQFEDEDEGVGSRACIASELLASIGGGRATSIDQVADVIIGSMLAAHRVPAAAAAWMLMLGARHPDRLEGLDDEASHYAAQIEGGQALPPMAYPIALSVVLESLRLYPPTWLLSRSAREPVELGGYRFPVGHQFLISPHVIHRMESNFESASVFDPARWRGKDRQDQRAYLPFGAGIHACPGSNLATAVLVSILLTTRSMAHVSDVSVQVRPNPRTTLIPDGLTLRVARGLDRTSSPKPVSRSRFQKRLPTMARLG